MSTSQRVLIVTGIFSPDIGGPASYARMLAEHLSAQHQVNIITYSSVFGNASDRGLSFSVVRVWKKFPWLLRNAAYAFEVFFAVRKSDVVLVLNTLNGGLPALVAKRFFKKRVVVKVPGDYAWQVAAEKQKTDLLIDKFQTAPKRGWIGILWRLQSYVVKHADEIIVPSEYLRNLVQGWGVLPERITVIYNAVHVEPSSLTKEEARKQIGIAGNIIVSVGRLAPWKGFRMLIKIMPRLLEINQFFRLVIVGSGSDYKVLAQMIRNLNLEKKVFLVGSQNHQKLPIYIRAADLFVLNTGYEGFSHQVLEVMAQGVPIITTAVGGNKEIIHQGENGFMVKYNDEFNLVEAIRSLWQHEDLREHFIEEGYTTVEHFKYETMLEETIRILLPNL